MYINTYPPTTLDTDIDRAKSPLHSLNFLSISTETLR